MIWGDACMRQIFFQKLKIYHRICIHLIAFELHMCSPYQGRSEGYVLGGGPRSLFADKVGVAEAWHGCGLGAVYDNDLIFL